MSSCSPPCFFRWQGSFTEVASPISDGFDRSFHERFLPTSLLVPVMKGKHSNGSQSLEQYSKEQGNSNTDVSNYLEHDHSSVDGIHADRATEINDSDKVSL